MRMVIDPSLGAYHRIALASERHGRAGSATRCAPKPTQDNTEAPGRRRDPAGWCETSSISGIRNETGPLPRQYVLISSR
jgi:hypothetical protein